MPVLEPIRVFVLLVGVISYSVAMMAYIFARHGDIKNFSVGFWAAIIGLTLAAPVILGVASGG